MSDEQKLRVEQDRGSRAARILEDDLFKEALEAVREHCHEMFRNAKPHDVEALQVARISLQCADAFERRITYHMKTGKMANDALLKIQELKERAIKRRAA